MPQEFSVEKWVFGRDWRLSAVCSVHNSPTCEFFRYGSIMCSPNINMSDTSRNLYLPKFFLQISILLQECILVRTFYVHFSLSQTNIPYFRSRKRKFCMTGSRDLRNKLMLDGTYEWWFSNNSQVRQDCVSSTDCHCGLISKIETLYARYSGVNLSAS